MIVYDLQCAADGAVFEAWFRSAADYDEQAARSLVSCPMCGCTSVSKAPMAPRLPARANASADPLKKLAAAQAELLQNSRWVGREFADTARAMNHREIDPALVEGEASRAEVLGLVEDGVPIAPLPLPVVPPDQIN